MEAAQGDLVLRAFLSGRTCLSHSQERLHQAARELAQTPESFVELLARGACPLVEDGNTFWAPVRVGCSQSPSRCRQSLCSCPAGDLLWRRWEMLCAHKQNRPLPTGQFQLPGLLLALRGWESMSSVWWGLEIPLLLAEWPLHLALLRLCSSHCLWPCAEKQSAPLRLQTGAPCSWGHYFKNCVKRGREYAL